jgi:hypothetical protein
MEGASEAGAICRCKSGPGKDEQSAWKRVLREAAAMPNTKRTQRGAWGVGVSHEMMKPRERRLSLWSNATCAMPSCEALSSRRGRGPHHVHKDRVGSWESSCLTAVVEWLVRLAARIGKTRSRSR